MKNKTEINLRLWELVDTVAKDHDPSVRMAVHRMAVSAFWYGCTTMASDSLDRADEVRGWIKKVSG